MSAQSAPPLDSSSLLPDQAVLHCFAHQRGRATTRLLRRVLRRVLETAFEKVLRRVPRRCLAVGFRGRKGSEKGS